MPYEYTNKAELNNHLLTNRIPDYDLLHAVPLLLDILHTFWSCLHLFPRSKQNNLLTKNDCPKYGFSFNLGYVLNILIASFPFSIQVPSKLKASVELNKLNEYDPFEYLISLSQLISNYTTSQDPFQLNLLPLQTKHDNDILASTLYDNHICIQHEIVFYIYW